MKTVLKSPERIILLWIILLCFAVIFSPFFHVIALSIITAYFATPLYKRFQRKCSSLLAMALTWLSIILIVFIPIMTIGTIAYQQSKKIVADVSEQTMLIEDDMEYWFEKNSTGEKITNFIDENAEIINSLYDTVIWKIKKIWEYFAGKVGVFVKNIPLLLIKFLLYSFITTYLIKDWERIKKLLFDIIPINKSILEHYLEKMQYMTDGVIRGNFIIASIQALATAISFIIAGIPYGGLVLIVSFLLYVPMLWTAILSVPATIYLIIQWKYFLAVFIFIWNNILIANVDNILRGNFLPKEVKIHNTLMFLSVLSGMLLFGIMGIIYGPIITIIGLTSINLYKELSSKK